MRKKTLLEIKIKSDNPVFIENLMALLKESEKTEFVITSPVSTETITAEDKFRFLSSDLFSTNFDTRILNCLMSSSFDFKFVFEIVKKKESLLKLQNFGKISQRNLEAEFKKNGLDFNNVPKKLLESVKLYRKSIE